MTTGRRGLAAKEIKSMEQQKFKYIEISQEINENTFIALESNDFERVKHALLSIVWYSGDYPMSITCTRRFFNSNDELIRGFSIECIRHIARLFRKLPDEFIEKTLESLNDESHYVKGQAEFTVNDLEIFIKGFKKHHNKFKKDSQSIKT